MSGIDAGSVSGSGGESDAHAPVVRFLAGGPTDDELAATYAVIAALLAEQSALGAARVLPPVDHWALTARQPRGPVYPAPGAWSASRGQRGC